MKTIWKTSIWKCVLFFDRFFFSPKLNIVRLVDFKVACMDYFNYAINNITPKCLDCPLLSMLWLGCSCTFTCYMFAKDTPELCSHQSTRTRKRCIPARRDWQTPLYIRITHDSHRAITDKSHCKYSCVCFLTKCWLSFTHACFIQVSFLLVYTCPIDDGRPQCFFVF